MIVGPILFKSFAFMDVVILVFSKFYSMNYSDRLFPSMCLIEQRIPQPHIGKIAVIIINTEYKAWGKIIYFIPVLDYLSIKNKALSERGGTVGCLIY